MDLTMLADAEGSRNRPAVAGLFTLAASLLHNLKCQFLLKRLKITQLRGPASDQRVAASTRHALAAFDILYANEQRRDMGASNFLARICLARDDAPTARRWRRQPRRRYVHFPPSSDFPFVTLYREATMLKVCLGALTVATFAALIGPASAQQATTPPAAPAQSDSAQSKAPEGAHSYFVNLKNGDTVTSPFKVVFGLTPNMGVAPSGVEKPNVGHHHLLIDKTLSAEEMTQPITVDEQHVHFGKGQTETMVTLPPGKHTLQLVLGDWTHVPFNPPVQSEVITITVKAEASAAKPANAMAEESKEMHHHHHHHHAHRYTK
jgi:Domain of unknown function (DUF4399)